MIIEKLVKTAQTKALVQTEKQRMTEAAIAIDFYNGRTELHMRQVLEWMYPNSHQDIQKYSVTNDLTRNIINKLGTLFQMPPEIEIYKGNNDMEALNEQFKQMLADAEFHKKLIHADRMAELVKKVGLVPRWHKADGRVVIDIITPDICTVETDPEDPTKAIAVYYQIGQSQNPYQNRPVNIFGKWTKETYSQVEMNDDLKPIKVIPGSEIPNVYGAIPIVWLCTAIESNSFWVEHGYPVVAGHINVNLRDTNFDVGIDYQSLAILAGKGLDPSKDVVIGATRMVHLPDETDMGLQSNSMLEFITPNTNLQAIQEVIARKKVDIAKQAGLSSEAFSQDTSNITSGYQLRLTERTIIENNDLKKEIYRPEIIKLLTNMMICQNTNTGNERLRYPEDTEIYFNYIDKVIPVSPIEKVQTQAAEKALGTKSTPDLIRENNPGLTQEDAIAEAKRVQTEQNALNGGRPFTLQDIEAE